MKIKALCGITAPDPKGESYEYRPDDVGNCADEHAKYLIGEGFAEKARKDADITARPVAKKPALARPGTPKANLKPGKAGAVKARVPPPPKPSKPARVSGPTDAELVREESVRGSARSALLGDD